MRRRFFVLLAAGLIGLVAGCGSSNSSRDSGSHPSANTSAHNSVDVEFAQMMIPHHEQAIEMAALVATRAGSGAVKSLATDIDGAQGPEITTMTGWLKAWGQPTSHMGGMHMGHGSMPGLMSNEDMSILKTLTGKAFDKQFLTMMVSHHRGAILMAQKEKKDGKNSEAVALAKRIATSQAAQITEMRKLLASNAG